MPTLIRICPKCRNSHVGLMRLITIAPLPTHTAVTYQCMSCHTEEQIINRQPQYEEQQQYRHYG